MILISAANVAPRYNLRYMETSSGMRLGFHQLFESLGKGGMGEVYRARNARLDRAVAIKLLPSVAWCGLMAM